MNNHEKTILFYLRKQFPKTSADTVKLLFAVFTNRLL